MDSSLNSYKMFGTTTEAPSEYAADIWIGRFRNGLAIANVENRQALLELLLVFNGKGYVSVGLSIVFEMLRSTRR